ncbi:hypothetical protein BDU57DRAFT_129607 [Ampelomyces quisqualis]|uniref:Uncharacterized protein n=1 Tax=Ampelomyces quisqualis TaxID=50730 RepID=A0A6A5QX15_AMPQU|nr:hypothetical protein BDU57DRAFT_129607 [Ampelomyces quisqualis]
MVSPFLLPIVFSAHNFQNKTKQNKNNITSPKMLLHTLDGGFRAQDNSRMQLSTTNLPDFASRGTTFTTSHKPFLLLHTLDGGLWAQDNSRMHLKHPHRRIRLRPNPSLPKQHSYFCIPLMAALELRSIQECSCSTLITMSPTSTTSPLHCTLLMAAFELRTIQDCN